MAIKSYYEESLYCVNIDRNAIGPLDELVQQFLAENYGVGVLGGYYDDGLSVCLISELALDRLGYPDIKAFKAATGYRFLSCVPKSDAASFSPDDFRAFHGAKMHLLQMADGQSRWFRLFKGELLLPDGTPLWLMTLSDFDELHKREQKLAEARDAAEQASRAKSDFLSRMSHDIRTPLNGILGMTRIAQEHLDDPTILSDALNKIAAAGGQLQLLISDVLDMSRLESGRVEILHEPFNLCALLARDGSVLHNQMEAKHQDIYTHFNQKHANVIGSPLHVQRIISNVSSNAVKYTPDGGTIRYTLDEIPLDDTHSTYRFTIQDTGIGISEEFLPHLFEPFSQERLTARTHYQGSGLGLAITRELVHQMGGTIQVQSKLNIGTTFIIELPLELDLTAQDTSSAPSETIRLDGMHILLAEDNELNHEIATYLLTRYGAVVSVAENGKQALDAFLASGTDGHPAFDAILMDVMMPEMDGLEATRHIRASGHPQAKTIPIIAQTANAFSEDVRAALAAGMNDHLAKPLDELHLLQTLARYRNL